MTTPTVLDIAELAYRFREERFSQYSLADYAYTINQAAESNHLLFACSEGHLVGFVYWTSNRIDKTLHVENIVCLERWVIKSFLQQFKQRYPDYTIVAERRGKPVIYNTSNLLDKFNV